MASLLPALADSLFVPVRLLSHALGAGLSNRVDAERFPAGRHLAEALPRPAKFVDVWRARSTVTLAIRGFWRFISILPFR